MKWIVLTAALAAIILLSMGCTSYMFSQETSFFSEFSLRELVEKNQSFMGLDCSVSGGGFGGGTGGGGLGRQEVHSHKAESFFCRLKADEAGYFNESGVLAVLRREVEKHIGESGAEIIGQGNPDTNSFYFAYTSGNIRGRVEVSGRNMVGNNYSLAADLEEKSEKETK